MPETEDAVVTQIEILISVENFDEVDLSVYLRNDQTGEIVTIFERPSLNSDVLDEVASDLIFNGLRPV